MVVFCSASFMEDHGECSVIQGILLFIVSQTVSPYTSCNIWPIVMYNLDSRRRYMIDIIAP